MAKVVVIIEDVGETTDFKWYVIDKPKDGKFTTSIVFGKMFESFFNEMMVSICLAASKGFGEEYKFEINHE